MNKGNARSVNAFLRNGQADLMVKQQATQAAVGDGRRVRSVPIRKGGDRGVLNTTLGGGHLWCVWRSEVCGEVRSTRRLLKTMSSTMQLNTTTPRLTCHHWGGISCTKPVLFRTTLYHAVQGVD